MKQPRTKRLVITLSAEEYAELERAVPVGMPMATWARWRLGLLAAEKREEGQSDGG